MFFGHNFLRAHILIWAYTLIFEISHSYANYDRELHQEKVMSSFRINEIYIINLDVRKDKWTNIQQKLTQFGLSPLRFPAINGWRLDRRELKNTYRNHVEKSHIQYISQGQIGCFLSHVAVLKDALTKGYNCIWVLEDDIVILDDLNELGGVIEKLNIFDPQWDLLFTDVNTRGLNLNEIWTFEMFLGDYFDYSLVKDPNFIPQENQDFKRIEYRLGTHSMIISNRGVKKLLEYFENLKISFPIDVQMHCCPNKRFYISKKEFVTHGERHGSDTSFNPNL
jgi:GR25 family glycosyltransferase involved in LPS biosynthesis